MSSSIRLLLMGIPASPIFELGERLSAFHCLNLTTIERNPDTGCDSYFRDKIPSLSFDLGDFSTGSAQEQMVRNPQSAELDHQMDSLEVPLIDAPLDEEEMQEIMCIEDGVIVTELPDTKLVQWATHVVFLDADIKEAILWFSRRRKCFSCGAVFHIQDKPPRIGNICDRCGSDLRIKDEDRADNVSFMYKTWRRAFVDMRTACSGVANYKVIRIDKVKDFEEICNQVDDWLKRTSGRENVNWSYPQV